ncbi:MAG: glycine--tRNA ligase subunit beta [Rhodospirillaceae bacterium]|nr:glycine--tRNA ligase subunit beta [Rhodospirillaceae bacterium]
MAELLLEILSEEIPARMQARAAEDLKRLVTDGLKSAGLEFENAAAYVTPRRLALVVDGLPTETPDISEERRGPKTDAPEKAINGFLGSVGLSLDQLEKRETDKGEFYFAAIEKKGEQTKDLLSGLINETLPKVPWPKSMRWADRSERWVRPMQGIVAVFDGGPVAVSFGAITAGATTRAHRFLTDTELTVTDFADYKKQLEVGHVILDAGERRQIIKAGAEKLAADAGLQLRDDPALLDEVAGLVEWPVPLMGSIDAEFMDIPPEVLTTTMRKNQKYFALEDKSGKLAPKFITVANKETPDNGAAITAGNERVLRARLADAKFFWDQDRRATLESRVDALQDITFHAKLGTLAEKMERVGALAAELSGAVGADAEQAKRAAKLAKADLSTGMVTEFADVQGIMGRYYALADGEAPEVAEAIADHYRPQGPSDACPTAPVSVAVALADKIDTLLGFWAIDEKPTGSKDPFALRRAALGVIRLVMENDLRIELAAIFELHLKTVFKDKLFHRLGERHDRVKEIDPDAEPSFEEAVHESTMFGAKTYYIEVVDLMSFIADRLKVHLREKGVRHDLVSAVFALGGEDDLVRLLARVEALGAFLGTEDGANLLTAYKRAANILRIEEKKDGESYTRAPDASLLEQDEEKALYAALEKLSGEIPPILGEERFADAMKLLAGLRAPVDAYFDGVTVNCDDAELRVNRLRTLSQIREAMNNVADFSQIEGGER